MTGRDMTGRDMTGRDMTGMAADEVVYRDTVVVGSGVAGLTTALGLGSATIITKGTLGLGGSTPWSQGGIAAAIGDDDSPELHAIDTVAVSGGIGDAAIAALLTSRASSRIQWLLGLDAKFDRASDGTLALGREAGHSRRRILHSGGDATGAEVARALTAATVAHPDIEIVEDAFAVDLLLSGDRVVGVLVLRAGALVAYVAPAVVLATGGIGRVYAKTTNPVEVTGDAVAMALRAGATLADVEFVQFHPTALAADADPMPLLTEALRGEGAVLIDGSGDRFMQAIHRDAELAPRDIVAREVFARMNGGNPVYLDATDAVGSAFPERFPTVYAAALGVGLDPITTPLPVSPAAHFHMGGIAIDRDGRSSLRGLWAVGEASSSGVHGANRLASNSLLEGLVFGARVADSIDRDRDSIRHEEFSVPAGALTVTDDVDADAELLARQIMWEHVGVVRSSEGMGRALDSLVRLDPRLRHTLSGRNMLDVAESVTRAALARKESRGGHYRSDYPAADHALAARSFQVPRSQPMVPVRTPMRVGASDAA